MSNQCELCVLKRNRLHASAVLEEGMFWLLPRCLAGGSVDQQGHVTPSESGVSMRIESRRVRATRLNLSSKRSTCIRENIQALED
jgi:hypothetical protein